MMTHRSRPAGPVPEKQGPAEPRQPNAWWQWVLVYPTLLVTFVGAIPTFVEAVRSARAEVSFGRSHEAVEQEDSWDRNLSCLNSLSGNVVTASNGQVASTICESGDVLILFTGPRGEKVYHWVPVKKFGKKLADFSIISKAYADSPTRSDEAVICQWIPEAGWVIRRLQNAVSKECYEERINTKTGEVVTRRRVKCNQICRLAFLHGSVVFLAMPG